jgi:hypothetical protein
MSFHATGITGTSTSFSSNFFLKKFKSRKELGVTNGVRNGRNVITTVKQEVGKKEIEE